MDEVVWQAVLHTGEDVGTVVPVRGDADRPPETLDEDNTAGAHPKGLWTLAGFDAEARTAEYRHGSGENS